MVTNLDQLTALVVLVVAAGVTAGSAAICRMYYRALSRIPRHNGLLVWHVVVISSAVAGVWITLALGQLDILGLLYTPRWVRLILYASFGLATIAALFIIGKVQRRRLRCLTQYETTITERRSTVVDS